MSKSPSYLGRMLGLLEFVATQDGSAALASEAAQRLDMPLSTAARQVTLLEELGFVRRSQDGALMPGPRLFRMALCTVAQLPRDEGLRTAVRTLALETGESVSAGVLVGAEIMLVARQESAHPLRIAAQVGDLVTAHNSAMGKAVLANLPRPRQLALLRASLGAAAGHAESEAEETLDGLAAELDEVRKYGYAVDEETYHPGQRCRAAAIPDSRGNAYMAISVAGPTVRFTAEHARACLPALLAAVNELSPWLTGDR
ncbi:IclR family transcriptional regulator [Streptosporangium sp. KLBMP 9127]|nr:IclR family transcriptional regulator [Streptosporangium sp. KLBMP 9127]